MGRNSAEASSMLVESTGGVARHAAEPLSIAYSLAVAAGVFGLYMVTALVLEARAATTHFGADSWYYSELAQGDVFARIKQSYFLDRVARFHPTTVLFAAAWMQTVGSLARWIAPIYLLKSMFAVIGAVGAWAALSAFATIMPRRHATILALIYATSFGVWYFASFEESKIITASLSTLYIAIYMQLRKRHTTLGVVMLTATLVFASLNEMVSGLLVIIPIVDVFVRRGLSWASDRWIVFQVLTVPAAYFFIEGVMFGRMVATTHPEGTSHIGMFFAYIAQNKYNAETISSFFYNWFFFNIAAPTPDAAFGVPVGANYKGQPFKGYFEPSLLNYLLHPASIGVAVLFCVLCAAVALPRYRPAFPTGDSIKATVLALVTFTVLRGAFFLVFNPGEALLFSPAVTLPHLLLAAIPFTYSRLPAKGALLGSFLALLCLANGAFMFGRLA